MHCSPRWIAAVVHCSHLLVKPLLSLPMLLAYIISLYIHVVDVKAVADRYGSMKAERRVILGFGHIGCRGSRALTEELLAGFGSVTLLGPPDRG